VRAVVFALGLCLLSPSIPAEEPPRSEATSQEPTPAATPAPTGLQTPRETMVVTPNRGRQTSIIDSSAAVSVTPVMRSPWPPIAASASSCARSRA
jgi:hypothetical protein